MALPVRDFVIQRLLEFDPNFDVGAGVPTTGLLIDPLSVILQPVIDELGLLQLSQSVLSILETSDPDSFPEDIVDGLASNAFVERNPGAIGSDVQRIRFFEPQDFAAQIGVQVFRGASGQRYINSESISITAAEMSLNQEGNLFFADIPIIAFEEGEAFNADPGSITTMEAEPPGVANVTNLFGIQQGRDRETNTELIDRIKVAVTVRALVTGRGIIVTLTENFTTIEEIIPIGMGDAEMMRDIVFNVHIGGNVDVYVKTPAFTAASFDAFALEVDTSRRRSANSTVALLLADIGFSIGFSPVDRTNTVPVVGSVDGVSSYVEGTDYTVDDINGLISRPTGSSIVHFEGLGGSIPAPVPPATNINTLVKVGAFVTARAGMQLTVDVPSSVAGSYTIKSKIDDDTVSIFGDFPASAGSGVDFKVDDVLAVSFEYNPVTVDIINVARATDRIPFTITNTPLMQITSIEVLDPLSGETTGVLLDGNGGYGAGGYGLGGYGIGSGADFEIVVDKPTLRHSAKEDSYINFLGIHLGKSVRINYEHASSVPVIQAFMDDRDEQNQSASLIARHFIPAYVDATQTIVYDINTADEATAITVEAMTTLLKTFIDDIDQGGDLQISDLVDVLYNNGAIRVDLGTMNSIRSEIHNHDGSIIFALPTTDGSIAIPDDPIPDPTDKPLSPRIARFRARSITLQRNLV